MADVVPELVSSVLADIRCGGALSLAAAGRLFPGHRGGRAVNPSTVFRWVTRGVKSPAGGTVRLEAVRVGQRWLTSGAAVERFVTTLTGQPTDARPTPPARTPCQQHRASERAAAMLEEMGA